MTDYRIYAWARFLHCFAHSVSGVDVVIDGSAVVVSATARANRVERATKVSFMVNSNSERLLDHNSRR